MNADLFKRCDTCQATRGGRVTPMSQDCQWCRARLRTNIISVLCGLVTGLLLYIVLSLIDVAKSQDLPWTEQEVLLGKLAVNEASGLEADTVAIAQARGRYSPDELRRMHPRALAPVRHDRRRWIAGLNSEMAEPADWPQGRVSWDPDGVRMWTRTLTIVRETLRGERSVCSETPQVWGSRHLDADRLERIFARGGREVCRGTQNAFVRFE